MSNKNRAVREELIRMYGEKCMYHSGIRNIKPPKTSNKKYKGKKLDKQLTLHHLVPVNRYKARGIHGETTVENGAILCRKCHTYLETLPDEEREKINDELREYKRQHSKECQVEYVEQLEFDFVINAFVFTPEDLKKNKAKGKEEGER